MSGTAEKRDVGKLLVQIGDAMQSRAESQHYRGLRASVDQPPANLVELPRKRTASLHAEDPNKTCLQVTSFGRKLDCLVSFTCSLLGIPNVLIAYLFCMLYSRDPPRRIIWVREEVRRVST